MLVKQRSITLKAEQWRPGRLIAGVLKIPASLVDQSATRGIIFDRPERHVVKTEFGQAELADGDWVVSGKHGELYVFKDIVFFSYFESTSWVSRIVSVIKGVLK